MNSQKDQEIVRATLSEAGAGLSSFLPSLGNAEAIAVGEGVPLPMRLRFSDLATEERPKSRTAPFSDRWQTDELNRDFMQRIVDSWRGLETDTGGERRIA
jgi:hypothetical protein